MELRRQGASVKEPFVVEVLDSYISQMVTYERCVVGLIGPGGWLDVYHKLQATQRLRIRLTSRTTLDFK